MVVSDAFSSAKLFGVRIVVEQLNQYKQVRKRDTIGGTSNLTAVFKKGYYYRLRASKRSYHDKDTLFMVENTAPILLSLYPKLCYNLKISLRDKATFESVKKAKLSIYNIHDSTTTTLKTTTGMANFCGACNTEYSITIEQEGYIKHQQNVQLLSDNCFQASEQSISKTIDLTTNYNASFLEGMPYFIPQLTFLDEGTTLSIEADKALNKIALWLKAYPDKLLSITFKASYFQELPFNRRLAERRARVVERQLINKGVGSHRFILKCQGWIERNMLHLNPKQQLLIKILNPEKEQQ